MLRMILISVFLIGVVISVVVAENTKEAKNALISERHELSKMKKSVLYSSIREQLNQFEKSEGRTPSSQSDSQSESQWTNELGGLNFWHWSKEPGSREYWMRGSEIGSQKFFEILEVSASNQSFLLKNEELKILSSVCNGLISDAETLPYFCNHL